MYFQVEEAERALGRRSKHLLINSRCVCDGLKSKLLGAVRVVRVVGDGISEMKKHVVQKGKMEDEIAMRNGEGQMVM